MRGELVELLPGQGHRHPLAGRNFECYSEDHYLTTELAVAYVEGVQSRGVGCAVKHFVANDQEHERMEVSAEVDERTLREIYLPPFEAAVQRAGVWAVMSAYNRLHGVHCSQNPELLHDILRRDWAKGLGRKLQGKLHIYVGEVDNYYLNNAVYLVEEFLKGTTNPHYDGQVDYEPRAEHCWNGDHTRPNAISRLRYHQMFAPRIVQRMLATAPTGGDVTSWRY